jgi:hypothetical protein
VRGDSLRDFYAKVLAILGLGLIAGIGALVDYWPVGVTTPALVAGPALGPAMPSLPSASAVPVPRPPVFAAARHVTPALPAPIPVLALAEPTTGGLPIGEPVSLTAPPEPIAPPVVAVEAPASPIELSAPPPVVDLVPALVPPSTRMLAAAPSEPGFVMGALKKTGAGIVKTGSVAGATIADAFKGVFGAFKKVSPFKDRAFGTN